jgi:tetratricopeptide (TPR) repeat protein
VLIPVAREDFERRQRKLAWGGALLACVIAVAGAAYYRWSVDPLRAQEAFDAAERLVRSARYEQGILSLERAIAIKPNFVLAFSLRGRAKMELSKPGEAIPDFSRVIELRPNDPGGYVDRGRAYLQLEQHEKALSDFDRAAALQPRLAVAHYQRGLVLRRLGDSTQALEAFNQAVALAPVMRHYFERAATLQLLGRHKEALDDLSVVIDFDTLNPQARFARANSYFALKDDKNGEADRRIGNALEGHE